MDEMVSRATTAGSRFVVALRRRLVGTEPQRGDVPGWVLITFVTVP
jgi:hypothetical protein